MILPDMIYDHGLQLPDLADFPDAGEVTFPSDVDWLPFDGEFNQAMREHNIDKFQIAYTKLCMDIFSNVNLSPGAKAAHQSQSARITQFTQLYFNSCKNQVDRDDIPDNKISNDLDKYGCSHFKIDPGKIQAIKMMLSEQIDRLLAIQDHEAKPHFYDRFVTMRKTDRPDVFKAVEEIFNQNNVFTGSSKYNRNSRNLALDTIALHIATPSDTHHYQTLKDLPTTSKCISLHMDPKFNLIKSILYLQDVDEDAGPFTTVPTSNRWFYDPFERMVACGNSTGNYLDSQDKRDAILCMPSKMRKNVILGRYILDGTDASKMLLSKMHKYTSDHADCIIFDPTQTLHRGGLCNKGHRINLQILMR